MLALGILCFVHHFCMDAVSVIVTWGPQVSFKARDSAFSPKLLAKWATDSPAVRRTGSMQSNKKGNKKQCLLIPRVLMLFLTLIKTLTIQRQN